MFVLGGLQGGLGWWMVSSGLVERPDVSHYRLTAHLGLAVIIYAYGMWIAMGLLKPVSGQLKNRLQGLYRLALGLSAAVFIVMLSGGLVAGLDAGFAYNTFPTMNGQWLPDGIAMMSPWYVNIFENTITVQFDHRWLALATAAGIAVFWFRAVRSDLSPGARLAIHLVLGAVILQVVLGVVTLVNVVPLAVAAAHQAGAMLLLSTMLAAAHALRSMAN
jgi:cytochrome c oxidase assembly protein subunit 15